LQGAYPDIAADIVLSDDDDHAKVARPLGQNDSAGRAEPSMGRVSTGDDVEVLEMTSTETANAELNVVGTHGSTMPTAADRVQTTSASSARGRKHPHIFAKRSDQNHRAAHVITQIVLPLYNGPQSPLDLVPSEIVFNRIF
jgi:hypothetical protein